MTDEPHLTPHLVNCVCCQEPYVQEWHAIGTVTEMSYQDEDGNDIGLGSGPATVFLGERHDPCVKRGEP